MFQDADFGNGNNDEELVHHADPGTGNAEEVDNSETTERS
jgi:hypothetical protein